MINSSILAHYDKTNIVASFAAPRNYVDVSLLNDLKCVVREVAGQNLHCYPDGSRQTFSFDVNGNRAAIQDATGLFTYTYDARDAMSGLLALRGSRLTCSYDDAGNRTADVSLRLGLLTFAYDANNRLASAVNSLGERTTLTYDAIGRRTLEVRRDGSRTSIVYDAADQMTQLYNLKADNNVIVGAAYAYDKAANRTSELGNDGSHTTYTYDRTYQLTNEHRSGVSAYQTTHVWDAVGNRTLKQADGIRTTGVFDGADQIVTLQDNTGVCTYTFDASGNQQIVLAPSGQRTTNAWSYENMNTLVQLPSGTRVTMAYNADNRRTDKLE